MPNLLFAASPTRLVAPIPGVPESQAKALDRRRRLNRQLQSFRANDRDRASQPTKALNETVEPDPA